MGIFGTILCLSSVVVVTVSYTLPGPGTTPNITDVLRGRCEEYHQCLHGGLCFPYYRNVDCDAVVESFLNAVRGVDPCATSYYAYDDFFQMLPPLTKRSTTMFWSGVSSAYIPHDIAEITQEYAVLGETFPGYMAVNLSFCGSTVDPSGFNYTVCPTEDTDRAGCSNNTVATFWDRVSELFTLQAEGEVYIVLNKHRERASYRNESTLARIEVPVFSPSKVSNVAIYLIPDFTDSTPDHQRTQETCDTGSIAYLRGLLTAQGLQHTCEEDPQDIMWLQCARYPDSQYCEPYTKRDDNGNGATPLFAGVSMTLFMLQVVFALISH